MRILEAIPTASPEMLRREKALWRIIFLNATFR
jgi:hypothetical protein